MGFRRWELVTLISLHVFMYCACVCCLYLCNQWKPGFNVHSPLQKGVWELKHYLVSMEIRRSSFEYNYFNILVSNKKLKLIFYKKKESMGTPAVKERCEKRENFL